MRPVRQQRRNDRDYHGGGGGEYAIDLEQYGAIDPRSLHLIAPPTKAHRAQRLILDNRDQLHYSLKAAPENMDIDTLLDEFAELQSALPEKSTVHRFLGVLNFICCSAMAGCAALRMIDYDSEKVFMDAFYLVFTGYLVVFSFLLAAAELEYTAVTIYCRFLTEGKGKGCLLLFIGLLLFDPKRFADLWVSLIITLIGVLNIAMQCVHPSELMSPMQRSEESKSEKPEQRDEPVGAAQLLFGHEEDFGADGVYNSQAQQAAIVQEKLKKPSFSPDEYDVLLVKKSSRRKSNQARSSSASRQQLGARADTMRATVEVDRLPPMIDHFEKRKKRFGAQSNRSNRSESNIITL